MKGMIHVYTGDSKGKTTAAFGLAARAVGHGKQVLFVQFLKGGGTESGEILAANGMLPNMQVIRFDQIHPLFDATVDPEALREQVAQDFDHLRRLIKDERYHMVVLDEINNCVAQDFLPLEALLALLDEKPEAVELVVTGRGADPAVVERADYVTEMKLIKHPAETWGTPPRKGVEF
ncbi:MAG: cob(I)yrinic acid a,c-diamide adenosyltransferase [bacterium]|nr:cob(I)yrinic acid a,c-diamide adenosyltransferase [bacterium]